MTVTRHRCCHMVQLRHARASLLQSGLGHDHSSPRIGIIQLHQEVTGLNMIALFDCDLGDHSRQLAAHIDA